MALTARVAELAGDGSGGVPEWSGRMVPLGERVGVMMVHNADTRTHEPPLGWDFLGQEPEEMPEYDAEAWFLVAWT